jgi:hypothetical protein
VLVHFSHHANTSRDFRSHHTKAAADDVIEWPPVIHLVKVIAADRQCEIGVAGRCTGIACPVDEVDCRASLISVCSCKVA